MSTLLPQISDDINTSLKKGDHIRVGTLRFLLSAIRNDAIAKYGADSDTKVTDEDVLGVVKKQVKTHKESIEAFEKAGRQELRDQEKAELAILSAFLPAEISDEELKSLLEPVIAGGEENFGVLMKQSMAAVNGKADGGRVASILKQLVQT